MGNQERVGVAFGGPSPEHDISILTGLQACHAVREAKPDIVPLYWSKAGRWYEVPADLEAIDFVDGVPTKARELEFRPQAGVGFVRRRSLGVAAVVICCHGAPGEDGALQSLLDLAAIPYTGPSASVSALAMDKLAFGLFATGAGVPVVPRMLLSPESVPTFPPPFIVKPRHGGSSLGVEVVSDLESARALGRTSPHLRSGAIIEPFLPAVRDLNIAVRTFPQQEMSAIEEPAVEGEVGLTFESKYLKGRGLEDADRKLPAKIPGSTEAEIKRISAQISALLGLRGLVRFDFLASGDDLWLGELNTIPGALAWFLWISPRRTLRELVLDMINEALEHGPRRFETLGSDGRALRSANSMQRKLS